MKASPSDVQYTGVPVFFLNNKYLLQIQRLRGTQDLGQPLQDIFEDRRLQEIGEMGQSNSEYGVLNTGLNPWQQQLSSV